MRDVVLFPLLLCSGSSSCRCHQSGGPCASFELYCCCCCCSVECLTRCLARCVHGSRGGQKASESVPCLYVAFLPEEGNVVDLTLLVRYPKASHIYSAQTGSTEKFGHVCVLSPQSDVGLGAPPWWGHRRQESDSSRRHSVPSFAHAWHALSCGAITWRQSSLELKSIFFSGYTCDRKPPPRHDSTAVT